jgi:hypothetical protein
MRLLRIVLGLMLCTIVSPASATVFARDTFNLAVPGGSPGYSVGKIHGQGFGTGWSADTQVQGSLCTSSSNTATGGGRSGFNWVDGYSGSSTTADVIAPNVFTFPGLVLGTGMLSSKKSSSDIRAFRTFDVTQAALDAFRKGSSSIGNGTIFLGVMTRLNTPGTATGHCGVHLYETLPGPLSSCQAGKAGERLYFGDRNFKGAVASTVYNVGRTTQGGNGAAIFDTMTQFDSTAHLEVLRIRFNVSSACDAGVNGPANCTKCPIDPATNLPSLCNDEITYWLDPPAGPLPPTLATQGPHPVQDFAFDSVSIGSGQGSGGGQEGCDFGALTLTDSYADLFELPANDSCLNAEAIDLEPDLPVDVYGTTIGALDDYQTFCADMTPAADSPDVVYQLNVAAPGTLYMSLNDGSGAHPFNGALELRTSACADEHNGQNMRTLCYNQHSVGAGEGDAIDIAAGTFWVVVDSIGAPGDFSLSFDLAPALCGDGVVNESVGETCEPTSSNDPGCFGIDDEFPCKVKPQPMQLEACPGLPEVIAAGESLVWGPFTTMGALDDTIGSCLGGNRHGSDQVIQVTPSASGSLTLTIGVDPATGVAYCLEPSTCWNSGIGCPAECWAGAIYVRTTCADAATQTACDWAYSSPWDGPTPTFFVEHVTIPVTAGVPYFVFVDGISSSSLPHSAGPYFVEANLQ